MIIREQRPSVKEIHLGGRINEHELEILVDCGATRNYINSEWVERFDLILKEDVAIVTEFGNNNTETSNKTISTSIFMPLLDKDRWITFYELEKSKNYFNIGIEILMNNDVRLDFGKDTISMEGKDYSFLHEEHQLDLDDLLCRNINFKCSEKKDIDKMISLYKENNYKYA
ncbi:protein DDI1-like [Vairimorpha necatrix]|uniref:Protein DDI1-like n=1 Tax=Vairimorpha necatrix TaxID=6039 RepID=A0AAX4JD74_9MICR